LPSANTLRFYLDENIPEAAATAARRSGLDVLPAREVGRQHLTDAEQLRWAAEQGRCMVTRDVGDFPRLSRRFAESQLPHAGVALVPRSLPDDETGGIVRALMALSEMYEEGLPSYTVVYLSAAGSR
jgi:predicted nuclease of predicted toxin-antitoxin system